MKRFLLRCLLWILVLFGLEGGMYLADFRFPSFNGREVFNSISLSKKKSGKSLLILGDSVGQQLYPSQRTYPDAVSLSCNQAVTMAGQYFLLHNYLEANADALPERVVLVCTPQCLQNDLDQFTFQYFLKPFYTREYKPLFNEILTARLSQIPHYQAARLPFIRVSNYAFAYELEPEAQYALVSPLSRSYLQKMSDLATSRGVSFSLACHPVRESLTGWVDSLCVSAGTNGEMEEELLEAYRSSIVPYPDSLFYDRYHYLRDHLPSNYEGQIQDR